MLVGSLSKSLLINEVLSGDHVSYITVNKNISKVTLNIQINK